MTVLDRPMSRNSVIAGTGLVLALGVACKLGAGVKEVFLAAWTGTSDALDIYLIAFLLPTTLVSVVNGCLATSFIPQLQKLKLAGSSEVHRLYSNVMIISLGISLSTCVVLWLGRRWLISAIATGFPAWKQEETAQCMLILLPVLVLSGLTLVWSAILNAAGRYAVPQLAPLLTSLCILTLPVALRTEKASAPLLATATSVGALLEFCVVGWSLKGAGYRLKPQLPQLHNTTRVVLSEFVFLSSSNLAMLGVGIIGQSYAAGLGAGGVAILNYGSRLALMAAALASQAIATVALPEFAALAARREWTTLKSTAWRYGFRTASIVVLTALLLSFASEPLVRFLFQRGAFSAANVEPVSKLQVFYFLQLPFIVVGLIGTRILMATNTSSSVLLVGAMNLVVAAIATRYLVRSYGLLGIGMATLVMYILAATVTITLAWRRLRAKVRCEDEAQLEHSHEFSRI